MLDVLSVLKECEVIFCTYQTLRQQSTSLLSLYQWKYSISVRSLAKSTLQLIFCNLIANSTVKINILL